jgi:ribosomal protein S18 acetylase RimI-like enzyme
MVAEYMIREARPQDLDTLVDFTLREAREAEALDLNAAVVRRGMQRVFADPQLATYRVAETVTGRVVASTSVVREWSNFHAGHYWWIQSLYVDPPHRGAGLVELLLDHVVRMATSAGALDVRLYAHEGNARALRVYRRLGFEEAPYVIMRLRPGPAAAG